MEYALDAQRPVLRPDLTVVLLVWQDADFLRNCLDSIVRARGDLGLEIVLVENGVRVDPAHYASGSVPVQLIHNDANRGVAVARNQGLGQARGRHVLLLDVDTIVLQDALETLVAFMDAHQEVGLAGARLQDADGSLQLSCRKLPTVWSKFLRRIPTRWARTALADELLEGYDHRTPRAVDYCIGACQIIRRQALEQVGLLDEQFFYGPEDVDYCIRMWRKGWRVMYVPDAVVIHNEQRLTQKRAFSKLTLTHAVGLARYFVKYRYAFTRPMLWENQHVGRM